MELAQGEKLGPYEIQRKLGAGGMGVVYRAMDSRLGRAVAIKVLPAALKGDPERLKRFEREARTIGGLNHGNLVTLFDVGVHDGVPFLVTELLEGKSLREALAAAPNRRFAVREAVRIAGEIARGLAAAHGAGVTHRDIKPENIFVLPDERVKVLDFGIAKLTDMAGEGDAADGNAATLAGVGGGIGGRGGATAHTGTGMVVGTPGYMAPEQLAGGAVGPRTDLFALGVVFYEMLAGRRPFAGDDDASASGASNIEESYAILKQVTPELPTSVPPAISRVVRRCLEKRPEARFQSASDLAFALGDIEANSSAAFSQAHHAAAASAMAATAAQPAIVVGVGTESSGIPALPGATGAGHVKTLPGAAVILPTDVPTPDPDDDATRRGRRGRRSRRGRRLRRGEPGAAAIDAKADRNGDANADLDDDDDVDGIDADADGDDRDDDDDGDDSNGDDAASADGTSGGRRRSAGGTSADGTSADGTSGDARKSARRMAAGGTSDDGAAKSGRISAPKLTTGSGRRLATSPSTGEAAAVAPGKANPGPWIFGAVAVVAVASVIGLKIVRGSGGGASASAAPIAPASPSTSWPGLVDGGPEYHRVTALPQTSTYARFAKDDASVFWSARKGEWRVMRSDVAQPSIADVELTGRVLDVSKAGELALRVKGTGEGGTLQRALPGKPPVFVADHVEEAMWAPDGNRFAILRAMPDRSVVLEYPIGTVIASPRGDGGGSLAMLAMAKSGAIGVAFADTIPAVNGRVSGRATILSTTGELVAQSKPYGRLDGLAFAGDELWFSEGTNIRALGRDGKERVIVRSVLPLGLRDVADDGRLLVAPREQRTRTLLGPVALDTKPSEMKNVGWFDGTEVTGMSADGKTIAFLETGARDADGYPAYRRKGTDAPTAMGRAFAIALLPDASAALVITGATSPARLVPADGKPPTELARGAIARFDLADHPTVAWSGKWAVVRAAAQGKHMRLWRYDLTTPGAPPVAIGPDSIVDGPHPISSDGAWIAVTDRGSGIQLLSTAEPAEPTQQVTLDTAAAARGEDEHVPLAFSDDDKSLVIAPLHSYPRTLERYDLTAKKRVALATIAPEEKPDAINIVVDSQGATWAYSLVIETSDLYVIRPPLGSAPPP